MSVSGIAVVLVKGSESRQDQRGKIEATCKARGFP
jgi:hypothetical protein